jgi:ADP-ribose pyrophosphatase YjhB (NUDIX family)
MQIKSYSTRNKMLVAVDCIIFGFDGNELKLLLIQRAFEPEMGKWSLMGGFVHPQESFESAAARVLNELTGLHDVYMEQLHAFGDPSRDPIQRTASISYFSLIDIARYELQITDAYDAEWFPLKKIPPVIFDHTKMIEMARDRLKYKAALHPILFELLPEKFTLKQLQSLYEGIYDAMLDKRNFSRKILSTGLLVKQKDKEKETSKKGAFYFKLNKKKYQSKINEFLNFIRNPNGLK